MNHNKKRQSLIVRNRAYRQALERLDIALEQNTTSNNYEIIRAMRAAYFADVDEFEKSGAVVIPKM